MQFWLSGEAIPLPQGGGGGGSQVGFGTINNDVDAPQID